MILGHEAEPKSRLPSRGNLQRHGDRASVPACRGRRLDLLLAAKKLESSRKENPVAFAADLGVVDDGCCRVGHELETMPGAYGRGCRDCDGNVPNLEEVPGKMVHRVFDADEAFGDAAPLDV